MTTVSKYDMSGLRTAQDLEQKYDFASILNLKTAVEYQLDELIKVENELYATLNALAINLDGVVDAQASLWFYPGVPTVDSQPENGWLSPDTRESHVGDLYYNASAGEVYKYTADYTWERNFDLRLLQAMALTNHNLLEGDNERKVFFAQPAPAYESGDWWIKEDGSLFICQIGRATGSYVENDFIISSEFANAVASADTNMLTIVSGTVTMLKATSDSLSVLLQNTATYTNSLGETVANIDTQTNSILATTSQLSIDLSNTTASLNNVIANGVSQVTTTTGYKFNAEGLLITKTDGTGLSTLITNNGMQIISNKGIVGLEKTMLTIDSQKIEAENITVRKYLTVGTNSRVEDYLTGTGVFYVGT